MPSGFINYIITRGACQCIYIKKYTALLLQKNVLCGIIYLKNHTGKVRIKMKTKNYSAIIEDSATETKAIYVFMAIIELVLGIFLIIYPDIGTKILTIILGAILAGFGVFNIISFLMNKNASFRQGILSGVISTALGIAFIAQAETVVNVTSIILGVFIVFEGLTCCKRALIMKRLDFEKWFVPMIISLITCVIGTLILIVPGFFGKAVMIISGVILSLEAVLGIVSIIMIIKLRDKVEELLGNDEKAIVVKQ